MDSFTAGVLLNATLKTTSVQERNRLVDFAKSLTGDRPTAEVVAYVESIKTRQCRISHTSHLGIVVGPNMAKGGFYDGGRYPVLVKITESGAAAAVDEIFEYELDQVELI